ncbi:transposase [Escherichia coli]|nr:transposase [Escherichia coli]
MATDRKTFCLVLPQRKRWINSKGVNDVRRTHVKSGFAPIFPDICYHLPHYKPAAADIPVASDNPAHYADAIRYNARTPLQGSLLPLTRLVWA